MTSKIDIQALRLRTVAKFPYLASALWSMTLVEAPGMQTMGVDRHWRLYIDPAILDVWSLDEQVGVVVHEVHHLLRGHHKRASSLGINPPLSGNPPDLDLLIRARVWNMAADCGINNEITHEVTLPKDGCLPSKYDLPDGQISEFYFDELMKQVDSGKLPVQVNMMMIGGNEPGEGQGQADPTGGFDGSGACNIAGAWEVGKQSDEHGEGMSEAEAELVRRQVAKDIQEQKNRGNVPGYMQRWADEKLNPKIDWRTKLMSAIRGQVAQVSGMVDYTYRRPSRRQSSCPRIVLPSLRGSLPEIAVGQDTSGSMSDKDIARAIAETAGILNAVQANIKVYAGDTQVYEKQIIRRIQDMKLQGGGGTDMGAIIQAMDDDKCSFGIIITDGYTNWPNKRPRHLKKVIIVLTQDNERANVPDFYEVITVDD